MREELDLRGQERELRILDSNHTDVLIFMSSSFVFCFLFFSVAVVVGCVSVFSKYQDSVRLCHVFRLVTL